MRDYDRDLPLLFAAESWSAIKERDGSWTSLYEIGFRMSVRFHARVNMPIHNEDVDPRALAAVVWLKERGHLDYVHSFQGQHVIVGLPLSEFLLFKMAFAL